MFKLSRLSIFTAAIILALLFSAFPLGAVMAEGEQPAPPETPVSEEVPAVTEEAPAPEEETAPTLEEVIAEAPEGVVVVPVDPAGQPMPMAEEATAQSLVSGDPIFCEAGFAWGDTDHCTGPLATIEDAITAAAASGSGTIFVAVDYSDLTPAPVVIDGSTWLNGPSWLNLVGGVDFSTGEITGKTVLNRPIEVSNLLSFAMQDFVISGVTGDALTISQVVDAYVFFSDLSENTGAGLNMDVSGSAYLEDVKIDTNGAASTVNANNISLHGVSASGNPTEGGMVLNSTQDTMVEFSKFNNNAGDGLTADAGGSIFALCNQALNNVFVDLQDFENNAVGMDLNSTAYDIMLLCNKLKNNSGYGIRASAESGTIFMGSNIIFGNGDDRLPDPVVEQYAPCEYLCPSCKGDGSGGEEEPKEGKTQVVIVNVDAPNGSVEFKSGYATVFKLMEEKKGKEKEIQRTILMSGSAPDGSTGVYTPLDESELPAPLAEGTTFLPYGFNLSITDPEGNPLDAILGYMVIRFYLPEGFVLPGGMRLVIQYFDTATSSWTLMSTGVGGGMAYTYASKPGTYVLTMVPIQ